MRIINTSTKGNDQKTPETPIMGGNASIDKSNVKYFFLFFIVELPFMK